MADKKTPKNQSSTNSSSLAQIGSLSEAFSWSDFSNIKVEELINDPAAAKIITILYAQSEKERKLAEGKISSLMAKVKYYQSMQAVSIAFAAVNILGTITISLGISLNMNWAIIGIGIILVLGGEIIPRVLHKKGEDE